MANYSAYIWFITGDRVKLNSHNMYTESQLISFGNHVLANPTEDNAVIAAHLEAWKWEHQLPLINEGSELYDTPCAVTIDDVKYKGLIKKQYNANKKFAYDVMIEKGSGTELLTEIPAHQVTRLDLLH